MGILVPAILPSSRRDLEDKLSRLVGLADRVQIDVVDGKFATPPTWPYSEGLDMFQKEVANQETLLEMGRFRFEVDLMVEDPEAVCGMWISAGANKLTVHAESTRYIARLIDTLKNTYGYDKDFAPGLLSLGLALNVESDLALIEQYLNDIDYVQFMGIAHIGHQGEPFDERVVRKITQFKRVYPHVSVQVDGGVSLSNAPALLSAGANKLVVGSALWKASDLGEEILRFEEIGEKYGIYH